MRCALPAVVSRVGAGTAPVKVWAALIENNTPGDIGRAGVARDPKSA